MCLGIALLEIFATLIATLILWSSLKSADADFTTLFSHKFFKNRKNKYKGKVIWITGSSSGIGKEIAFIFARLGCRLVISGTSFEKLEKVRDKCEQCNPDTEVLMLCGDISFTKLHPLWLNQVIETFGDVHVLINNAGRSQRSNVLKTPEDVERALFDVNVFSVMSLTRTVVSRWVAKNQRDRAILVTSSTAGKLGAPHSATYCAGKHALHGYFESLRSELCVKEFPLQITLACPGPVRSNVRVMAFIDELGLVYNMSDDDVTKSEREKQKLMDTDRCAELMVSGFANGLDELWIAQQPILTVYYLAQYLPSIFRMRILPYVMNKKTQEIRDGQLSDYPL